MIQAVVIPAHELSKHYGDETAVDGTGFTDASGAVSGLLVGSTAVGRWLGGLDRTLRAMMPSPFVGQTLAPLAGSENAADLTVRTGLVESGQVTPVVHRTCPVENATAALRPELDGNTRDEVVVSVLPSAMQIPSPRSTP